MTGATVLIVDDEHTLARSAQAFLADHGYETEVASTGEKALELLASVQPDVVFADVRLPGMSGIDLLKRIGEFDPVLPVVMVTAYGTIEGAVEAVKLGAFDYVKKPVDLEELKLLAERARADRLLKQELSYYRQRATRDVGFAGMIGASPAIRAVLERARQIAALDETPPVLLTGETGTGKGLLAHAIHASGPRAMRPFIEVNCTALPATLMEAELFGHERGAFTDAKESKPGLVEAAEGGFLFLDEIGDVDLSVQGKLLRAIEERTVRRVGSVRERRVDVRIMAATNRDLERAVGEERRSEEHTSELQSQSNLVCRLLLEKKKETIELARQLVALTQPALRYTMEAVRALRFLTVPQSRASLDGDDDALRVRADDHRRRGDQ